MAYIRTTRASAYIEFAGNTRRLVTSVVGGVELSPSQRVLTTSVRAQIELSPPQRELVTAVSAYVESSASNDVHTSAVLAYVEFIPDNSTTLTPSVIPAESDADQAKVAGIIGIVNLQSRLSLMSQMAVYAELVDKHLYTTKFINLVEISLDDVRATSFVVLVEIELQQSAGIIIIGNTKSWKDVYPKNITDISPLHGYNFILESAALSMIDLSWEDVDDEDGYEIERSNNGVSGWELIHTTGPDVTNYTSVLLEANTTYYYRIRSFNEGGYSAYSDVISETTRKIGPSLLGEAHAANVTENIIEIKRPSNINVGDYMLMQIGVQDANWINYPNGWTLETIVHGNYDNLIFSRTMGANEPASYQITRQEDKDFIVTAAIFAWDASNDTIVFFDS